MTNETQGARIILDPFLEHPKLGLLLAECQCPQSDFRTGQSLHTILSWFALQNQVQCSDSKSWGISCKISTCITSTITILNFELLLQVSPSLDQLVQVLALPFSF